MHILLGTSDVVPCCSKLWSLDHQCWDLIEMSHLGLHSWPTTNVLCIFTRCLGRFAYVLKFEKQAVCNLVGIKSVLRHKG